MNKPIKTRVMERIQIWPLDSNDPCWIWTGYTHPKNGPRIRHEGQLESVRRVLFTTETNKELNSTRLLVAKCKEKMCVNPKHMSMTKRKTLMKKIGIKYWGKNE